MDFALLEDFDHLYRYANLLKIDEDIPAHKLTRDTIEFTPGRPTIAHHRHPSDAVRMPRNAKTADIRTTLGAMILTAAEQQTMNFYMNLGNTVSEGAGRDLYQEIGMVEEEHVTHYGALLDPTLHAGWRTCCSTSTRSATCTIRSTRRKWTATSRRSGKSTSSRRCCTCTWPCDLLKKYEGTEWQEVIPDGEFPELLKFQPTKDYVREVLASQVTLTAENEEFADIDDIPSDYHFFAWNEHINGRTQDVPSHRVINEAIKKDGEDYRFEDAESAVPALRAPQGRQHEAGPQARHRERRAPQARARSRDGLAALAARDEAARGGPANARRPQDPFPAAAFLFLPASGVRRIRAFPASIAASLAPCRPLQAARILERAAQDELHLGVHAPQVVGGPPLDRLPDGRVDAQRVLFAFRPWLVRPPDPWLGGRLLLTGTACPCSARAARRIRRTGPP